MPGIGYIYTIYGLLTCSFEIKAQNQKYDTIRGIIRSPSALGYVKHTNKTIIIIHVLV